MDAILEAPIVDTASESSAAEVLTGTEAAPETTAVAAPPEGATTEAPVDAAPETAAEGDGRVIPQNLRQVLDSLKASDPKTANEVKRLFFADRALKQAFPGGVPEALKAKEFVDSIGGEDGWQAAQAERTEWEAVDKAFVSGDPEFVKNIAAEYPEGFQKLVPAALEHYAQMDRDGYNHLAARIIVNTLSQSGFSRALQSAASLVKTQPEQAASILAEIEQWVSGIGEIAQKQPERRVDPERQKFEQEKQQFEQQKTAAFQKSVASDVTTHMNSGIEAELGKHFAKRGMNLEALKKQDADSFAILLQNCDAAIGRQLKTNATFQAQYKTILQAGDKDKAVKFAKAAIDKVMAQAVERTYRAFYTLGGGKSEAAQQRTAQTQARREPGAAGSTAQGSQLAKPPDSKDVDWSRTDASMVMDGKAFLKGRKEQVTFS